MFKFMLGFIALAALAATFEPPTDARLIKIRVLIHDVVILEGSTSDAGRQDADEVWRMVVDHVEGNHRSTTLRQTKSFRDEFVQTNKKGEQVISTPDKSKVTLEVVHGGQVALRELQIAKQPVADGEETPRWCLDPDQLKKHFDRRMVRRRDVSQLKHPDKLKF